MKKLCILLILFVSSLFTAFGQVELKPTDSLALFKVLVTNLKNVPCKGDKVSFVNAKTGVAFSGVSGADGKFEILIPKGEHYDVRVTIVGRDTTMRDIEVPSKPDYITINYNFRYSPPRTIKLDKVYFDTSKASLKPESYVMLNDLVEFLTDKPYINIEIAGHTDNVGGDAINLKLSQERAESVRNYLVKKGIDTKRLNPVGYGLTKPVDTNDTPEGRQHNRRTEVYIVSE